MPLPNKGHETFSTEMVGLANTSTLTFTRNAYSRVIIDDSHVYLSGSKDGIAGMADRRIDPSAVSYDSGGAVFNSETV